MRVLPEVFSQRMEKEEESPFEDVERERLLPLSREKCCKEKKSTLYYCIG